MGILRILLAICVFCDHTRPILGAHWLPGYLAVECFFVISGFYMQLILSEKYTPERLGHSWFWRFYQARYLRLYPAYFFGGMMVLVFSAYCHTYSASVLPAWNQIAALENAPPKFHL